MIINVLAACAGGLGQRSHGCVVLCAPLVWEEYDLMIFRFVGLWCDLCSLLFTEQSYELLDWGGFCFCGPVRCMTLANRQC